MIPARKRVLASLLTTAWLAMAWLSIVGLGLVCLSLALPSPAGAQPRKTHVFKAAQPGGTQLRIHSATDIDSFAGVVRDYQSLYPDTEIVYVDVTSQGMYDDYIRDPKRRDGPDLMLSSGMDLQFKLANDGYALRHRSMQTDATPEWTRWRHEVFGFSYEPVVIVYNTRLVPPARVPHSRRQLLGLLRDPAAGFAGRVGTYDATQSSVGYLLATQDHQTGSMAGALEAALGDSGVFLGGVTSTLLDRVASGELLLGYNVLGSYAQTRARAGAPIGVVWPEDYTLVLLRTALIPRTAGHPEEARRFLDYLLSPRGQQAMAQRAILLPIRSVAGDPLRPDSNASGRLRAPRPIPLGPGLLVYLDTLKRRQFLEAWRSTVQPARAPAKPDAGR